MNAALKRRLILLLVTFIVVGSVSNLFHKLSFDPDYSIFDSASSATWSTGKASHSSSSAISVWYTRSDVALDGDEEYEEVTIEHGGRTFVVLQRKDMPTGTITVAKSDDESYSDAVSLIAKYYTDAGYRVDVRKRTKMLILSMMHEKKFDVFLMREVQQ